MIRCAISSPFLIRELNFTLSLRTSMFTYFKPHSIYLNQIRVIFSLNYLLLSSETIQLALQKVVGRFTPIQIKVHSIALPLPPLHFKACGLEGPTVNSTNLLQTADGYMRSFNFTLPRDDHSSKKYFSICKITQNIPFNKLVFSLAAWHVTPSLLEQRSSTS